MYKQCTNIHHRSNVGMGGLVLTEQLKKIALNIHNLSDCQVVQYQ